VRNPFGVRLRGGIRGGVGVGVPALLPSLAAVDQPLLVLVNAFLYSIDSQYNARPQAGGNRRVAGVPAIWQSCNRAVWQGSEGAKLLIAAETVTAGLVRLQTSRTYAQRFSDAPARMQDASLWRCGDTVV
jgi:hypothetical protein